MPPYIRTETIGQGDAVGGPTLVGGQHQGVIGYISGPNFCSVIADLEDPESPYWGVVLGVDFADLTSKDTTTCVADTKANTCLQKSEHSLPFCATYLDSETFCARSFNSLVLLEPNTKNYIAALDNHARACVADTLETSVSFDPTNACHKAVAYGACNNVFPICADNAEIEELGPRGVCKNDCILER